jgi:hypothetical protein
MPEEPEKINFEEDLLKLFMRAIIFCWTRNNVRFFC